MSGSSQLVLVDFDGTISARDTLAALCDAEGTPFLAWETFDEGIAGLC